MMLRSIILRSLLFCAIWWMLTGSSSMKAWLFGIVPIALAVAVSLWMQAPGRRDFSISGIAGFLVFFIVRSIKGGVQVAIIALRPRLDLRPAILEMSLRSPHEAERMFIASTLSLLPGTLSAGLDGQRLHLHVLDARMPIESEVREVEAKVAHLFRLESP
jgi:multicomponent Na+:H+ antiporter subunit E